MPKIVSDEVIKLEKMNTPEVSNAAFMIEGSILIPAWLIAITKGEAAAVPPPLVNSGSSDGTISPMIVTPQM